MSKFHSTVSRRDFMKGLGLAGAGLGVAAAAAPVFHDLDELTSSPTAEAKRPWWVKKVDEPTVEIDWNLLKRYDNRLQTQVAWVNAQYAGKDAWLAMRVKAAEFATQSLGTKGSTIRDIALASGSNSDIHGDYGASAANKLFAGPQKAKTPEQVGLPKWSGTPEESTRIMRAAASFLGAARIGISELGAGGSKERNLVYTYYRGDGGADSYIDKWPPPLTACRKIVMEDVDPGYDDGQIVHVPNKPLWKISVMVPMAKEAWRTAMPDHLSSVASAANTSRYRLYNTVKLCLQDFLRGLGYMGYGTDESGRQLVPSQASAVLGGTAEMGRHSEACIDPEYGANMGYWTLVTDLPLAPDKPIDAGIFRFCHTCKRCATYCPSGAISMDDEPTWEIPSGGVNGVKGETPLYKVPNMSQNPGKKLFWSDQHNCVLWRNVYGCRICRPICTFNVNYASMAHTIAKTTVSTTPLFNGFLWKMSDVFGFGLKDSDEWWDLSLPTLGYDSTRVAYDGGYRK